MHPRSQVVARTHRCGFFFGVDFGLESPLEIGGAGRRMNSGAQRLRPGGGAAARVFTTSFPPRRRGVGHLIESRRELHGATPAPASLRCGLPRGEWRPRSASQRDSKLFQLGIS